MAERREDTGRNKRDGSHKREVWRWIMMMKTVEGEVMIGTHPDLQAQTHESRAGRRWKGGTFRESKKRGRRDERRLGEGREERCGGH